MPTRPCHHPWAIALADSPAGNVPTRPIQPRPIPRDERSTAVAPPRAAARAGSARAPRHTTDQGRVLAAAPSDARPAARWACEDGSVATEYGLLAVVAATIVSVLLEWATSGGISALLGSILARVSDLVGL